MWISIFLLSNNMHQYYLLRKLFVFSAKFQQVLDPRSLLSNFAVGSCLVLFLSLAWYSFTIRSYSIPIIFHPFVGFPCNLPSMTLWNKFPLCSTCPTQAFFLFLILVKWLLSYSACCRTILLVIFSVHSMCIMFFHSHTFLPVVFFCHSTLLCHRNSCSYFLIASSTICYDAS